MDRLLTVLNIFVFSQYLDLITTIRGIEIYGTMIEGNPIVSGLFSTYGPTGFIIAKVISSVIILVVGCFLYRYFKVQTIVFMCIVSVALIIIAIMNTTFLI